MNAASRSPTTEHAESGPRLNATARAWRRRWVYPPAVVVMVLLVTEAVLRVVFPIPEIASFNRAQYTPFDSVALASMSERGRGLSNVRIHWESEPDGFAFDHRLNLYGFRGPDFSIEPAPDRARVVFVGDSFTEGFGASDENTYPAQFERIASGATPVEAINLGIGANGLLEYMHMARDAVVLLRPNTLVVTVFGNDLPAQPFSAEMPPPPSRHRANPWNPRLVELIRRRKRGLVIPTRFAAGPIPFFVPTPSPRNPFTTRPPPPNLDPALLDAMRRGRLNPWIAGDGPVIEQWLRQDFSKSGSCLEHLRWIRDHCRAAAVRLMVVFVPFHAAVNPDYIAALNRLGGDPITATRLDDEPHRSQQRHLHEVAAQLGIEFVDMTECLSTAEKSRRVFWAFDGHCNAEGYRLIAEAVAKQWRNPEGRTGASAASAPAAGGSSPPPKSGS